LISIRAFDRRLRAENSMSTTCSSVLGKATIGPLVNGQRYLPLGTVRNMKRAASASVAPEDSDAWLKQVEEMRGNRSRLSGQNAAWKRCPHDCNSKRIY